MIQTILDPRRRAACCLAIAAGCLLPAGCGNHPEQDPSASTAQPDSQIDAPAADAPTAGQPSEPAVEFALAMERGRKLERDGKAPEARELYRGLTARHPERYEPYHRLGILADREQRFDEAQQFYARAVRLRPDDPDLFNDLGYSLFLQGKLDEAERELLKAVALAPMHARSRNNLGLVYGHLGRCEEALEQFLQAGSEADAHYNLAYVLVSVEDFARAKKCLERALAVDPKHERSLKALEEFRQFERAQEGSGTPAPTAESGPPATPDRPQPRPAAKTAALDGIRR